MFFLTFLYAIGFLGGFGVARTLDSGGAASPAGLALLVNVALLGLFGVQHLVAVQLEERDLSSLDPEYVEYQKRVPMWIPRLGRGKP